MSETDHTCPNCSSGEVKALAYGMPGFFLVDGHGSIDPTLDEMIQDGRALYKGSTVDHDSPAWACGECSHTWD